MNDALQRIVRSSPVGQDRTTTVTEAIESVREVTPIEDGAEIYYVYVTDGDELVGVVSLRELLNAEDDDTLDDVMREDVLTVSASASPREAANQIVDARIPVLPVVDDGGTFVGVVRANDVIDALDEASTKALFKQAGLWVR